MGQGPIQFGTYTFPNSFIVLTDETNFESDNVSIPGSIGSNDPTPKVKERNVMVQGGFSSGLWMPSSTMLSTAADVQAARDALFGALAATTVSGPAALVLPRTADRFYLARPDKPNETNMEGNGYRSCDLKLPFYCGDPRAFSTARHHTTMGPFVDTAVHTANFLNGGNYRSYPLFVVTAGAGANVGLNGLTIACAPPSGGTVAIILGTALSSVNGGVFGVNADRLQSMVAGGINQGGYPARSVTLGAPGGADGLLYATFSNTTSSGSFPGNLETFPYLDAGTTVISVQAGSAPAGGVNYTVDVYWFDVWV